MGGDNKTSELENLPFPPLMPSSFKIDDFSIRDDPEKRKTLRYFINYNNKRFRIKEFFMDWFYTGFPKSIMKTLMEVYGPMQTFTEDGNTWFYCMNYKGNDSASMYIRGTTVEIECNNPASPGEFLTILNDLDQSSFLFPKFRDMGFKERSFLASGNSTDWWEDKRIARMRWSDLEGGNSLEIGNNSMNVVSTGYLHEKDGSSHNIMILAEPYFRRVVWVETIETWSGISSGIYKFRKEPGLFDTLQGDESQIFHRSPNGPSVIRDSRNELTITVAFSPGFTLDEVKAVDQELDVLLEQARKFQTNP